MRRRVALVLHGLGERGANVAAQRIVAGHRLVGALQNDDVLLALESRDDGGFGEGTNHVDVNGADLHTARGAQVVDGSLDILRGRAERDEHRIGVVGLVAGDQAVGAASQLAELLVGVLKELKDGLGEVVAPRHHAVHVVFLVLHRPQQNGIGEVDHLGHAAAGGSKQHALRLGGTLNDVLGSAEILADQLRLMLVEGALQVRGQKAVHDVHARRKREFGHTAQNQRLVSSLLRVLAEKHDPAGIERAINVVVATVHVQGVLGQRTRAHLKHHRGALARRVIVLFHAVHHTLTRGKVDHPLAAH